MLQDLVEENLASESVLRAKSQTYLRTSYSRHYRRIVPRLLASLEFDSSNTVHRPVLDGIELLRRYVDRNERLFPADESIPLDGVVPRGWRPLISMIDASGHQRINRITYEIGFDTLNQYIESGADGGLVRISQQRNGWITVAPLEAQPAPANLELVKGELNQRWPATSLLDMLKEAELRLGLTDHFQTVATREALPADTLRRRLLLTIFALGTNTGIRRIAANDPVTESDLHYIRRRYLTPANLRHAITAVVNATLDARKMSLWGEGTTTASDSTKFGAWTRTC